MDPPAHETIYLITSKQGLVSSESIKFGFRKPGRNEFIPEEAGRYWKNLEKYEESQIHNLCNIVKPVNQCCNGIHFYTTWY